MKIATLFQKRTIPKDLMIGLMLMTVTFFIIYGSLFLVILYNTESSRVELEASKIIEEMSEILSIPLWDLDNRNIERVARSYLSSEFIIGLEIVADEQTLFDNIDDSEPNQMTKTKEIFHNGQPIGKVVVLFSKRQLTTSVKQNAFFMLANILILSLVIIVGIHLLMQEYLSKPLRHLISQVRMIAGGEYRSTLPPVPQGDLNDFISEINGMSKEIGNREKEMARLRNLLDSTVNSMPSALIGVDSEGFITQWNLEAERYTGISSRDAMGCLLPDVYPGLSAQMPNVRSAVAQKTPFREGRIKVEKEGETRFSDVTVYPLASDDLKGAVIRVDDVTEQIRMEEVMIQSEKMMSLGGLAAGMAHEINNPLAGIIQNVQVLQNRLSGNLPKYRLMAEKTGISQKNLDGYLRQIKVAPLLSSTIDSCSRAAKIVDNMLHLARKNDTSVNPQSISDLLLQTVELAQTDYHMKKKYDFRKISIIQEFEKDLPLVPCEKSKIQQVFFNIMQNGTQAMSGAGTVDPCLWLRVKKDDNTVRIEIEDNGPGMPERTRKRIFEPFFTTKDIGVGTGLGLSVSFFIITENHNGTIEVESTPEKGSKFIIRLPISVPGPSPGNHQ